VESAAVAGIVYAILAAVAWQLLVRFPQPTMSDEALASWYAESGNRWSLILALNLAAISSVAFLWFVAVLRRRIGDREDRFFATVFLGSALVWVAVWLVGAASLAAIAVAMGLSGGGSVSQDTATLAGGLGAGLLLVAGPRIQAIFVISTSTVFLRTGVAPRWLAFLGYVMGVGLFIFPLIIEPVGLGFPGWVLIVSVTILVIRRAHTD
jgi:hypothetical protein